MALGGRVPTFADIEAWTGSLLRKQQLAETGYGPAVAAFNNFKAVLARRFAQYSFATPNVTSAQVGTGWAFVNKVLNGESVIDVPSQPANAGTVYETGGPMATGGATGSIDTSKLAVVGLGLWLLTR